MENSNKKALINKDEKALDTVGCNPTPDPACGDIGISCNTVNIYINCNS